MSHHDHLKPIIFSTVGYAYLKERMQKVGDFDDGLVECKTFPDGERYRRIETEVNGREVIVLGGTISDSDTLELYDLASAVVKYGCQSLTLVVPYFGYSTMERADKPGEVVTGKTRARLLSVIPSAKQGNRAFFVDLHSTGLPYYFEGALTTRQLSAKSVTIAAAKKMAIDENDFVLACTDAGRAKWVESLAGEIGVSASIVLKRRVSGTQTDLVAVSAHVDGRYVIIYDDMIRTGGSLIMAAEAYKDAGASKISAIATHGVLAGDSLKRLQDSNLFSKIVCTDSHPRAVAQESEFLEIHSIAHVLASEFSKDPRQAPVVR